jgi:hypothetical protein
MPSTTLTAQSRLPSSIQHGRKWELPTHPTPSPPKQTWSMIPPWLPMNRYDSSAVTLCIMSHNTNHSSNALDTLLNTAGKTANIVLVQEAKIKDIWYTTTYPNFILLLPPSGTWTVNRIAAYILRLNPNLQVTPHPDICDNPDLQVLEVQMDLIPKLYLLNLYNEYDPLI